MGLTLAIMLGPIFVTITQISLQKGTKAGLVASSGVWLSDIIIVAASYLFVQRLDAIVHDATFTYWMGLLGGFILIVFGLGAILKQSTIVLSQEKHTTNDYIGFWTKGFLVNTVNPFTFVFWIGVISTYVIGKKISDSQTILFLTTILLVIIITDTLKVLLAKAIRNHLTQSAFDIFSKVAGVGLIIFGIALLWRSQVF